MSNNHNDKLIHLNYNCSIAMEPSTQLPLKKLRLVKKSALSTGSSSLTLINLLEECKNSAEALKILLSISDGFEIDQSDLAESVKKIE
ncbi:hypothetical protein NQ314_005101 [Rhamnusium bicolor]|uniref:Uncharacterized protein n=1 Tax=Rhamnusium bicolor TaxID=1586634 RepID=A0AAV8ZHX5_9CUCU|nr:hypothetical protein NQ314_005101 [Rhamnusium bicolor]